MSASKAATGNSRTVWAQGLPNDERYYYKDTGTLVNERGIRDQAVLREIEGEMVKGRSAQLRVSPEPSTFNKAHFQELHKRLFGGLYAWAGQFSAAEQQLQTRPAGLMSRAGSLSTQKDPDQMFADMRKDVMCPGQAKEELISTLARSTMEFAYWRPFPRGNDRTASVYLAQLASRAGVDFDMSRFPTKEWRGAFHQATVLRFDYPNRSTDVPLRNLVRASTRPLRAVAFSEAIRSGDRQAAMRRFPELKEVFRVMNEMQISPGANQQTGNPTDKRTVQKIQRGLDAWMDPGKMESRQLQQWILGPDKDNAR